MIKTKNRHIRDDFTLSPSELTINKQNNEPKSLGSQVHVVWDKAKDFNVYDRDGNQWIDMTAGIFTANAGHANENIKNAIKAQLDSDLIFAYQYETEIRDRFVTKLLEISPDYLNKAIVLNTGSEATDAIYRILKSWARHNKRKYIICFNGSYHGRVLGSALMGGSKTDTMWSGLNDDDIVFIDFPYSDNEVFDPNLLPPKEMIAAFFLETYQGWGACMYPPDYIKKLYDFAKENDVLVCFDEVQSGFYRMGELYGYTTYGDYIQPDLISVGKGLSSCLPISAVLGRADIIDLDPTTNLSGTHAGNAICCAAALANLEFLTNSEFQEDFQKRAAYFEERCEKLLDLELVSKVNYKGMVAGIIMNSTETANKAVESCLLNGVLPVCTFRESIKLGPPLTISMDAIEEAFDVIEDAISGAA
jgi:4-aminobutyrate aminotransferase/(S)-3-amino-2-methylpropionate transaminase